MCLSWYLQSSAAKQQWKKKEMDVLQPGGKANASLGDGIRYWLFSATPLLLPNYYNLLHVSQPLCGGRCITALFHTLNQKQSCDTGGVWETGEILRWACSVITFKHDNWLMQRLQSEGQRSWKRSKWRNYHAPWTPNCFPGALPTQNPLHGPFIWTGSHPQQAALQGTPRKSHQVLITVITIIIFYI